jgi:predicted nucleic acid-binding protein
MRKKFVFDACALIAFLNDEAGSDIVEELLEKAKHGKTDLIMNKVNLLEIYYGVYREDGEETAESVLQTIEKLPLQIIHLISDEVFLEAGRLKAKHKISLADSIAVAEANIRKSLLVTADHHELDKLEGLNIFKPYWIR